jgi:hypothetical protein
LFKALDNEGDKSGSISKDEFYTLCKRLEMKLSKQRISEIFAFIKAGSKNKESEDLNEEEFKKALKYLKTKNSQMSLDGLGISTGVLTIALIYIAVILILFFCFIFLGIKAFALGGTFGSVINSLMPMGNK